MKKQVVAILIALMLITSFSLAAMLSTSADNTKYLRVTVYGWQTLHEEYDKDAETYEHFPFIVKVEYDNGEYYEPIEDAAVRFKGETKYTDKSGKVTFDAPEVDSLDESKYFRLIVSKEGFRDQTKNVYVYSALWSQTVDEYVWNETEDCWERAWSRLFQPRIYENMTFMLRVERDGYNFNCWGVPVENASVTFLNETKNTNENGEATFIAPVIPMGKKEFKVVSIVEDTEKIEYDEGYETYTTYICVYKRQTTEPGRVKHFTRTDSEGYTTKFDITGETWRVEWDYSTSSDYPYFSYHLLDEHGHIIHGVSSHDADYDSHGVVYLKGTGEDFYFQVWDANLWSWSIDVYQEVYPDEE